MADITAPPPPSPSAVRVALTCGDCIFFSNQRLPNAAAPCLNMGCPSSRAPCLRYAPNVFSDAVGEAIDNKALRAALNSVPDAAVASVAMALVEVSRLRAVGLTLGALVYFNAAGSTTGRDYIANYYRGRAMVLDKSGNLLIKGKGITATISLDSVVFSSAWKEKRAKLLAKGSIVDPKSPFTWERKDEKLLRSDKYRPAWLDKEIAKYRASYLEAKSTRQTHDYDSPNTKRGRGRPKGSGKKVKVADVTHYDEAA